MIFLDFFFVLSAHFLFIMLKLKDYLVFIYSMEFLHFHSMIIYFATDILSDTVKSFM